MSSPSRKREIEIEDLSKILAPYNPWWNGQGMGTLQPEAFRRPIFRRIYEDLKEIKQVVSITGPRRVGKTTLVRQLIEQLLQDGIDPQRILYFSLDDPLLLKAPLKEQFFDLMIRWLDTQKKLKDHPCYLFLDEIQRYEHWELFIKKYYDLSFPLRFVISGSASSPIFKKSRESLLGRIKDHHVLPFSFAEFVLFHTQGEPELQSFMERARSVGRDMRETSLIEWRTLPANQQKLEVAPKIYPRLEELLNTYFVEGGFPEAWAFQDLVKKQEYLFDNQVQKVIFEDLVLATEFRKPENVKAFYLSLIEQPGQELNLEKASARLGVSRPMLEKYFPLLEMTDLVKRVPKFSKKVMKVRRGNVKCYLVDLALRNAVLKLGSKVLEDPTILGVYAENLVFNALNSWEGIVNLSFFREKAREIDFIVTLGGKRYLPIEVKYRRQLDGLDHIRWFLDRYQQSFGLIVTQDWVPEPPERTLCLPLPIFLLVFS